MDLAACRPLPAGRNQRVRRDPVGASGEKHGSGAEFSAAATVDDPAFTFDSALSAGVMPVQEMLLPWCLW